MSGCSSETVAPEPVVENLPPPTLAPADREHLWLVEHHGGLLREFGWRAMAAALIDGDRQALRACLSPEFQGVVPAEPSADLARQSESVSPAQQQAHRTAIPSSTTPLAKQYGLRRWQSGDPTVAATAERLVAWLLGRVSEIDSTSLKVKFHLMSVQPQTRRAPEGDWVGTCKLEIEGQSTAEGPSSQRIQFAFRCQQPSREALEAGHWLHEFKVERVQASQAQRFLMRDVAAQRGLVHEHLHDNWKSSQKLIQTGGVYLLDHNRDGCVDVLVTDKTTPQGVYLYESDPDGGFRDVTQACGIPAARGCRHAAVVDLDGDGWEDLFLPGRMVLQNQQGQGFQDVTDQSNLNWLLRSRSTDLTLGGVSGVSIADYDGDGRVDLYVTRADVSNFNVGTWVDGRGGDIWGNQLLRNRGGWQFEDVTQASGTQGGNRSVFSSVWLDADNDGRSDVYLIHEFGHGVLLLNNGDGTFRELEFAARAQDYGSMGLGCGDINNDGWIDVYVASMYSKAGNRIIDNVPEGAYDAEIMAKFRRMVSGSQLHLNRGGLSFDPVGAAMHVADVGWAWTPALVDLNNDGWLDIHATCGFMSRSRDKPDG